MFYGSGSQLEEFCPPETFGNVWRHWFSQLRGGSTVGIYWVEARILLNVCFCYTDFTYVGPSHCLTCCFHVLYFLFSTACAQIVLLSFKYQQFNFTFLQVSFFSNQLVPFHCMLIIIIISFSFDISHTAILYSVSDSNIYGPYGGV